MGKVVFCVPLVPITIALYSPKAAVLDAVSVTVVLCVAGFGENVAVTPLGKPAAENFTVPLNPIPGFTSIQELAELPRPNERSYPPDNVKVGGSTVMLSGTVDVALPYVPLIVALYCPRLAALVAVSVSVVDELVEAGENVPVTPLGSPEMERLTFPPDAFCQSI